MLLLLNPFLENILLLLCGDIELNPGPSNIVSQAISVCYWNLNGIAAHNYVKISLLEAYNAVYNYDVICLGETFLDTSHQIDDPRLKLQGYELLRSDHPNSTRPRGGVSIYYKEHLPLRVRNDISPLQECLVCEIKINGKKCFITCLYRSPNQSPTEFIDFTDGLEATYLNINLELPFCSIVLGDFNAKCSRWYGSNDDHCGMVLETLSNTTSYSQIIKEITHFPPTGIPSCIDLIFTNQPELVYESGVHPSLYNTCHHQIIFAKIKFKVHLPPAYKREVWSYAKANVDLIKQSISNFNWVGVLRNLDTNAQVELFTETLLNIFRNFIPHKIITCNYKDPPWITNDLKSMLRKKNRLYKKFIMNGRNEIDKQSLNQYSLRCSELISASKNRHFNNLGKKLDDPLLGPKAFWSILNGFLGKMKIPVIPPLLVNGTFEIDFLSKANIFNKYFANQCNILDNGSILPEVRMKTNNRLNTIKIFNNDILTVVNDLNPTKAHGWDDISIRMIKICGETIVTPLRIIFETAIETGVYPDSWKCGNIVPVHKKADKNLVKNYRPISLLPICGKVFEKIIYNNLFNFFMANNILVKNQSGFLPGDSCVSQLLSITHEIYKAFDGNPSLEVRGVFLDISKAFDKVWHKGLLYKLKCYGVEGKAYALLENYLMNRKQRVVLNGQTSSWENVNAGVPQGSVLGPLLFLIYINDLPDGLKSNAKLFADDTSLFSTVFDTIKSSEILNSDLELIQNWAFQWKMSFNPDPNKQAAEVVFSHKIDKPSHPPINFNNNPVVPHLFHKHLGMTLDSKLNFDCHLIEKITKANRVIGMIRRIHNDLSRSSLLTIYKAHVRPHLDYGDIIYDRPNIDSFVNKIESVQYNAALAITGAIRGTSRERLYEELGLEHLSDRRWYRKLCMFWKIVNGSQCPKYLNEYLPRLQFSHNSERNKLFAKMKCHRDYYLYSFFPYCVNQWNTLDPAIRNTTSINSFKYALLQFIRPSKSSVYNIHEPFGLKLLTRLRLELSHLRDHKFKHNFQDTLNPLCSCSLEPETVKHYLLHCPFYDNQRKTLLDNIYQLDERISDLTESNLIRLLLYGDPNTFTNDINSSIVKFTIAFLIDSGRFDEALF